MKHTQLHYRRKTEIKKKKFSSIRYVGVVHKKTAIHNNMKNQHTLLHQRDKSNIHTKIWIRVNIVT